MIEDEDLKLLFQAEAQERLSYLEKGLKEPNPTVMENIFRAAHSLKGAARMLNLYSIEKLARQMEDLLDQARGGSSILNERLIECFDEALDALRELVKEAVNGMPARVDVERLMIRLQLSRPPLQEETKRFEEDFLLKEAPPLHEAKGQKNSDEAIDKILQTKKDTSFSVQKKVNREGQKRRILVVDDSYTMRMMLKRVLENEGYEVLAAEDGSEALDKLKEHLVDAVISDIEMPKMDGIALTAKIRLQEDYYQLPIILWTSMTEKEIKKKGLEAGASAYLVKSDFNQSKLLQTLENLIV
jgi:CheY-like chemotaxis protein/HPt (histidine-containing phosphotransfer) domain-containing protein